MLVCCAVTTCFESAISTANCTSVVDVNCFCVRYIHLSYLIHSLPLRFANAHSRSGKFPPGLVSCVSQSCSDQLSSAEQLSQQFCNLASTSTSLSFPTPSSTPSSSASATAPNTASSASTSSTSTSTSTKSGGAMRVGVGGWVSVGVGLMGVLGGALTI